MDSSESDYSWPFTTANIIDYEVLCLQTVYSKAPSIKKTLSSLEAFTKECKLIADRNGVEYYTYSQLHFLKEMVLTIPFDTAFLDFLVNINYSLCKPKFFDNFKNVLMNEYIHHMEKYLSTSLKASVELDGGILLTSQVETIVKKFLRVFHILKLDPELTSENLVQYEFLAELLKVCHSVNVQDSQLVVSLLKLTIDRYVSENCGVMFVRQPHYPHEFFEYILKHVTRVKFDLLQYYSNHSRTLWDCARNFSVICAASFGKVDQVLCLLQHGFDIFPDYEARHSGHGYPHIKEIMSPTNRMVLQIMSRMRLVNCFTSDSDQPPENGYYMTTPKQEECFRLIWRALPEPYVTHSQLALDISTEYFYLALHAIFRPFRHNKNLKLAAMYETCFEDMAVGPHEPRSLKHLCRCTIRKRLHQTRSLPNGVFHLGLPKSLEKYLNLEYD
ncbi:Ankyrin repeat and SOCS box protein 17 like protein [Argiope bruennichi]|uniref:Ankyrin repeat and SOCS box protein 17 like protein n=1 Tax=Argiope bruennichi TaxID=94029 RepID=A0A8T0FPH9_ARGBR|nr:Ankyrin repeat and SOCS box protein 17 like protein [Argiope bruennichi]